MYGRVRAWAQSKWGRRSRSRKCARTAAGLFESRSLPTTVAHHAELTNILSVSILEYLGLRREKGANLSPSCERDASVRPYSSTEVQQIWSLSVAAAAFSIAHRLPPSEGASTVGVPLWEADCNSVREATLTLCDNCDLKPCPVKGDRAAALAALDVWRRENRAAGR